MKNYIKPCREVRQLVQVEVGRVQKEIERELVQACKKRLERHAWLAKAIHAEKEGK